MKYIFSLIMSYGLILQAKNLTENISMTVAEVGSRVITSREIKIAGVLDHWFLVGAGTDNGTSKVKKQDYTGWLLDDRTESFRKELSAVILEYLAQAEAENFSIALVPMEEVQKLVAQIEMDLNDWSAWKKLEADHAELVAQVTRRLRARNFLKFKTEALGFHVTDEEARQYFEKNRKRFGNLPFQQFKDNIKEYISQRGIEGKQKDWIEVLRKKYRVRIINNESF